MPRHRKSEAPARVRQRRVEQAGRRKAKPDPSAPDRVTLAVNVVMTRAQPEARTTRAIREGKALRALIDELLAAAADRETT